jgi:hypothetical protein
MPIEFPGSYLEKTLSDIQSILNEAKPLAKKLLLDENNEEIKEAIVKCIEAAQDLLSQSKHQHESWQDNEESQTIEIWNERRKDHRKRVLLDKWDEGTITLNEVEELKRLLQEE